MQRGSSAGCTETPGSKVSSAIGELRSRAFRRGVEDSEKVLELALEVVREKNLSQDAKKEFVKKMLESDSSKEVGVRLAREWGIETSSVTGTLPEIIPPQEKETPRKELSEREVSEEVSNFIALANTTLETDSPWNEIVNSIAVAMNDDTLSNSEKEQAFDILRAQRGDSIVRGLRMELGVIAAVDFASKRDCDSVSEKKSKLKAMVDNLPDCARREVFCRMRARGLADLDYLADQVEGELATEAKGGRVAPSPTPTVTRSGPASSIAGDPEVIKVLKRIGDTNFRDREEVYKMTNEIASMIDHWFIGNQEKVIRSVFIVCGGIAQEVAAKLTNDEIHNAISNGSFHFENDPIFYNSPENLSDGQIVLHIVDRVTRMENESEAAECGVTLFNIFRRIRFFEDKEGLLEVLEGVRRRIKNEVYNKLRTRLIEGGVIDRRDVPPSEPAEVESGVQSDGDRDIAFGRMIDHNSEVINNNNAMIGGMIKVMNSLIDRLSEGTMPSARDVEAANERAAMAEAGAANAWQELRDLEQRRDAEMDNLRKERNAEIEGVTTLAAKIREEVDSLKEEINAANERATTAEAGAANAWQELRDLEQRRDAEMDNLRKERNAEIENVGTWAAKIREEVNSLKKEKDAEIEAANVRMAAAEVEAANVKKEMIALQAKLSAASDAD
jgi:hypothetical protein